jgi:hypothetical protein
MAFLQSRTEQVADHLRACIARGELISPLPNTREWSRRLGVGRSTLEKALRLLERDGLLETKARKGIYLAPAAEKVEASSHRRRTVRWLWHQRNLTAPGAFVESFYLAAERLEGSGIHFSFESCSTERLKTIHDAGQKDHELLLLTNFNRDLQALFSDFDRSALLIGMPEPGIDLPFQSIDVLSAMRHAVNSVARRGYTTATLFIHAYNSHAMDGPFEEMCAKAPMPIQAEIIRLSLGLEEQVRVISDYAAKLQGRRALIALYPVSVSLLTTACLKFGISLPQQVQIVALNADAAAISLIPFPLYYPYPTERVARALCRTALRFFEEGLVSPRERWIPLERRSPTESPVD